MDEIITEVRKIREEYVAEHNFSLDEIFADLKRKEASSNRRLLDLRRRTPKNPPNPNNSPLTPPENPPTEYPTVS